MRPIVDFQNSHTYNIAKMLTTILKKVIVNHPYTIKNSEEFVNEIKTIKTKPGEIKLSFDVVSTFHQNPHPRDPSNY